MIDRAIPGLVYVRFLRIIEWVVVCTGKVTNIPLVHEKQQKRKPGIREQQLNMYCD